MAKRARAKVPLHPAVSRFVTEGPGIADILEAPPDSGDAALGAIFKMQEALKGRGAMESAIQAAAGAVPALRDPNLGVLFLGLWANLTAYVEREAELSVLARRSLSLVTKATPPEIRAVALNVERLRLSFTGDWAGAEQVSRDIERSLPPGSPRYPAELMNLAEFLAGLGKAAEFDAKLAGLNERAGDRYKLNVAHLRCVNAAETGRVEQAIRLMSDCRSFAELPPKVATNLLFASRVLDFMRASMPRPGSEDLPWMAVTRRLLARQPEEALGLARSEAVVLRPLRPGFAGWSLIRAELSSGHGEAARRLLEERRKRGSVHYLDDLFLARADLLAGRREEAARRFAAARQACERYEALGRLDFELRLSCELAPLDLVALAGAALAPAASAAPAKPPRRPEAAGSGRLIGDSPAMAAVREMVRRVAPLDVPVLITGETGTGKELAARAIHEEGPRRGEPFIAVNCGAVAESLLESELFGHEKGAFTGAERAHKGLFEEAGKGTILLDEIGDTPPRLQVALLRVLETGEIRAVGSTASRKVTCRVLAATNADLLDLTESGTFRKDLFFRLRRMEVGIPPLRERREDLLPLAGHFLREGRTDGRQPVISEALRAALLAYAWPGNVRELKSEIERFRLLNSDGPVYDVGLLEPGRLGSPRAARGERAPAAAAELSGGDAVGALLAGGRTPLRRLDRLRALFREHGKLTRGEVARVLGVSAETATRDLKRLAAEGLIARVEPTASPRTHYFALRAPSQGTG